MKIMGLFLIILTAAVFLAGLLHFERTSSTPGLLATKPVVSLMFVAAALTLTPVDQGYASFILAALVFCFIGDVCLIFMAHRRLFLAGLVAFLTGHLIYICAFHRFFQFSWITAIAAAMAALAGSAVFRWLKPGLATMKIPVMAYILVISVMAVWAVSVSADSRWPLPGRILVLAGALSFYLSDICVARNQFKSPAYVNRLIGLPLYYAGQFLLAVSIAYMG